MEIQNFTFDLVRQFSQRDIEYQLHPEKFAEFIQFYPDLDGLKKATEKRKLFPVDRTLLCNVFKKQYSKRTLSERQKLNLERLEKENAFTITTAHQPCLFTGPAYYIYKIFSTIHLCKTLEKELPDCHFVPVFVNGSEDHDFSEVNHAHIFQKKITWTDHQKGPVGRYRIESLESVISEFSEILGKDDKALQIKALLSDAFHTAEDYNGFIISLLHGLTAEYGLLVLSMDDHELKRAFIPVMERELLHMESEKLVLQTQEELASFGYKPQAFPRPVNLFYFTENGSRERIIEENGWYSVLETNLHWSREELLEKLYEHPENFSPNVILRPLYQESILPDIAFVGGGGEIAYWMERKRQFSAFNIFFPCLIRRNSVFIVTKNIQKTIEKLDMTFTDFLPDDEKIIHAFLEKSDDKSNIFDSGKKELSDLWNGLSSYVSSYDKTLTGFMEAEKSKVYKILEHVEQKLFRVRKQHEETKIQQIKNVKEKLFPAKSLQERSDNFFQFYVQAEENLFDVLSENLNPLEKDCKVLIL